MPVAKRKIKCKIKTTGSSLTLVSPVEIYFRLLHDEGSFRIIAFDLATQQSRSHVNL